MASRYFFSRALRSSSNRAWYRIFGAGAACLGLLGAWAFYVHAEARRQALVDAERAAAVVAQAVARDEERLLDSAQQVLLGLARRPEILTANGAACAGVLAGVTRAVPGYLDVVAVSPRGEVFCAAGGGTRLPGVTEPADVQRAVESGGTVLGRPGIDRATRRPTLTVSVPAVDDAGAVRAVLVAALDLGVLLRAAMESPLPPGASLVLVDAAGVVLGHHPEPERWVGEIVGEPLSAVIAEHGAGLTAVSGLDGGAVLLLSEPLFRDPGRSGEASVVVTLPRRPVFREAERLFSLELAGLGLLALGGVIVSGLVLDRIVARPAEGMLRVIRSLNAGDTRARMRKSDEARASTVGRLARSLNALGRRMEEHQQTARHLEEQLRDARAMQLVATLPPPPVAPSAPAAAPSAPAESAAPEAEPTAHAGFREPPFENAPNPRFLWLSPSHADGLVRLTYALRQRRGCALLTGESGCGKTLLTRAVVQRLEPKRYDIALLTNPHGGRIDLLRQVLYELGVETTEATRAELVHLLHDLIVRNFRRGRETLVIVDDAQEAEEAAWFEELSALLNIQTNERSLVTIMLVGTPDLIDKVRDVPHLDRRVSLRCTLGALTEEQTGRYIRYRLGVAGGDEALFTPEAVAVVHAATHGVPRAINDLCDSALLLARLEGRSEIDEPLMRRVLSDTPAAAHA